MAIAAGNAIIANEVLPKMTKITLVSNGWYGNEQTVEVSGISSDEAKQAIYISPTGSADQLDVIANCNIRATAQGEGIITFVCDTTPSTNVEFYVKWEEINYIDPFKRSWTITFRPIDCKAINTCGNPSHNSGLNCTGWDLTQYNSALAEAEAWVNEGNYSGNVSWEVPSPNHIHGECIGDTCSGDDKCGMCHGGTSAQPCYPITVTYTVTRTITPPRT